MKKTANKLQEKSEKGEGHKARIAVDAKATVEIDGTKQSYNLNYDVTVTIEHIDYVVRQIAGGIAQAAGRVAKDGIGAVAR
jgi:hypothetical protein